MSIAELLPILQGLPRMEKFRVVQFLVSELAKEDGCMPLESGQEYPVWTPHHAFDAASTLLQFLEESGSSR